MKLTRRKALASIGAVAGGSGAVFGSGAFTQTEVSRDYGLTIASDSDAQLALEATSETDAVTDDSGVLQIDIDKINSQGDTVFGDIRNRTGGGETGAFTITNNDQSGESVWVYVPRALNVAEDGSLSPVSDTQQESVEFLVDADTTGDPDGSEGGADYRDISLPPAYPDTTTEFDGANTDNPNNAGASSLPKITNTGAVEIGSGNTLKVEIRVLVDGIRSELQEFDKVYRFAAQRSNPGDTGEDSDGDEAWSDVGALDGLNESDVLDSA